MSIIGLLDWDLTRWKQPICFNLELMKLSTYHKNILNDIVQMETSFSSDKCSKVYVQKDYEDFLYPENITKDPKVIFSGLALSNGKYSPMPLSIERNLADTSIYLNMKRYYQRTPESKAIFKKMLNAYHIRFSLDEKDFFDGWENQLYESETKINSVIIHDKNLIGNNDFKSGVDFIKDKYGRKNISFGFKFPIKINNEDQLYSWGIIQKIKELSVIEINFIPTNEILNQISLTRQNITYHFDNTWNEEMILNKLDIIFLQGIFLSKYGTEVFIKIDKDVCISNNLNLLINMLNEYFKSCVYYRNMLVFCFFTFCKYTYLSIPVDQKIEIFNYIKNYNNDLFDLFYDAEYAIYENNKIIPKMYNSKEIILGGGYGGFHYKKHLRKLPEQKNYADLLIPDNLYIRRD